MNPTLLLILHVVVQGVLIVRALLRPHREPASRIAWVAVIASLPLLGILGYVLFGEVDIGRRRVARLRQVLATLPALTPGESAAPTGSAQIPARHEHLFRVGQSISGFPPVGGNSARLCADSDATIDSIVQDIEGARDTVHLLFYIWLPDGNGCKVAAALIRAAARGVTCRAMADDLGSRLMIASPHWSAMETAGVRLARALPIGNPLMRVVRGRIDLRNHRKIVVIDDQITYCGSQNCADPAFTIKAAYAPWVDAAVRLSGPIARQNQRLFAGDWLAHVDDDLVEVLKRPPPAPGPVSDNGFAAQVIGTGPTVRYAAMPEMFCALIHSARRELVISTPYYVPNDALQAALCACARRGVATTLIFPQRNDSWIVGAASRSYYAELLEAGAQIFEYVGGLLHAKTLTLDGELCLIGSANMDRRSFDLNYENNMLVHDSALTVALRERQQSYLQSSRSVTLDAVTAWTWQERLRNNAVATLGPVL